MSERERLATGPFLPWDIFAGLVDSPTAIFYFGRSFLRVGSAKGKKIAEYEEDPTQQAHACVAPRAGQGGKQNNTKATKYRKSMQVCWPLWFL